MKHIRIFLMALTLAAPFIADALVDWQTSHQKPLTYAERLYVEAQS